MSFERIAPSSALSRFIECFWIVEIADPTPTIQKIIPDGFPEMIFHFGDPYMIKLNTKWSKQSWSLLGGQITHHFFLKNTGVSSILGVKFRPAAVSLLFNVDMHAFTNHVVSLKNLRRAGFKSIEVLMRNSESQTERINAIEQFLLNETPKAEGSDVINAAIERIYYSHGMIPVSDICLAAGCSERQLERMFRRHVGLSPKLYARIVRFAYIFQLVHRGRKMNGSELGIASGYYDQSHFIRNFKAFTGEEPSQYFFDQPNLANFFLRKR